MPNRIIKESICTSDTLDQLTWFEEVFWTRLIVNCDDYGRFDARIPILKSRLFPLKGSITDKSIQDALNKLSTVGLVTLYTYEGKPFLQLVTWSKHQQVRSQKSKYPDPSSPCAHMISNDIKCTRNPIQSNTISEYEYDSRPDAQSAPGRRPVITLLLNDKSNYPIYQDQVDRWSELYPAVSIISELKKMVGWLEANPTKRKTKSGILRFVTNWLSKEQDRGGKKGANTDQTSSRAPSYDIEAYERSSIFDDVPGGDASG